MLAHKPVAPQRRLISAGQIWGWWTSWTGSQSCPKELFRQDCAGGEKKKQLIETKDAKTFWKGITLVTDWNWNENKFFFLSIFCFGSKRRHRPASKQQIQQSQKSMNSSEAFASFVSGSHEEEEGRLPQGGSPGRKKLLSWTLGDAKHFFCQFCLGPRNMRRRRYETEGRHLIPQDMVMLLGHVDSVCLVVGFAAVKKLKTISKNEPQGWDLRENHGQKKFFFLFYLAENLGRCLNCWKQLVFEHELRESNKGTQPKGSHLLSHSWWLHSVICTIQLLKERFLLNKFLNRSSNFNR